MFNGKSFKNYTESDGIPGENVNGICVDKAESYGLYLPKDLLPTMGTSSLPMMKKNGINIRNWNNDNDLIATANGELVIGQYGGGVTIFKDGSGRVITEEDGLTDQRAHDIASDSEGNIWIATDGGGVFKYDGENIKKFNVDDGLASSEAYDIYIDDYDKVWVGTFGGGVAFYDGGVWGSLDTRDGLIGNTISAITSISGQKFFFAGGGGNGISQYTPSRNAGMVNISSVTTPTNKYFIDKSNSEDLSPLRLITGYVFHLMLLTTIQSRNSQHTNIDIKLLGMMKNGLNPSTGNEMDWIPEKTGDFEFSVQAIDRDLNYSNPKRCQIQCNSSLVPESIYVYSILGFIGLLLYLSGFTTNKYLKQRKLSAKLREESQRKDREARERLEEKNSELLDSQKAAEAANEAKSTFLANMSHELRTPLNAIIGYSEMLIEDAEDENEDFIPDLDKINSSGKHLLGLINDILDLSKVESGKMELYIEEFDLEKVIEEIESTIKPLVEKNNNSVEVEYNTEISTMNADITKIRQILLNLLKQCIKIHKGRADYD